MAPSTPLLPSKPIQTLRTHTGPINTITFSHLGGTYILTGSSDRQIHLSRTEPSSTSAVTTTSPIQKYTSHGYAILSITVTNQNTHFASSGGDRAIFYWDIQTPNTTLRRFGTNTSQGHSSRITAVAFAGADDGVLVSGSDDTTVRLWDVKSRDPKPIQIWEEAKDSVSCVNIVGDAEVITGSVDGKVRAYDLRMGRVVTDVQPGAVTSLDITRDGKCMLVGCLDGKIRLMDRDNGACLKTFPEESHRAGYTNQAFRLQSCLAANEALVLSGSETDGKIRAWDVLSGKLVNDVKVSEDDKVVSVVRWRAGSKAQERSNVWAAGGADGVVRIYA